MDEREETAVVELEGKGFDPWREKRVDARANLLFMYLKLYEGQGKRFTQAELCEALAIGTDARLLREAVEKLEDRGWLEVDRNHKPHRYTLN
jgi:DNA-binding transcriptional regulator PaaX